MNEPTDLEHEYALLINGIYNMMSKSWQAGFSDNPDITRYVKVLLRKIENEQTK